MVPVLAAFLRDREGGVALIFGLAVIPILGALGATLDYSRAAEFRSFLSRETDLAALAIASSDTPNTDTIKDGLRTRALTHFGASGGRNPVKSVDVQSDWTGGELLTVTATTSFQPSILSAVPGMPKTVTVSAVTDVSRIPAKWQWTLPEVSDLSYEAGDYNRISVYCYDETKKNTANKGRRLETLTAISDNGGTTYRNAMPRCNDGETLSYMLRNVRNSRTNKNNWDNKNAEHYLYFTDTQADPNTRIMTNTVAGGREDANGNITYTDLSNAQILETVLCNTKSACKTRSDGGTLANDNETHDPQTATGGCAEGKYMFYGWEDRPPFPGGGSDKDYDDIRIVVSCPTLVKISDKEVKIVR